MLVCRWRRRGRIWSIVRRWWRLIVVGCWRGWGLWRRVIRRRVCSRGGGRGAGGGRVFPGRGPRGGGGGGIGGGCGRGGGLWRRGTGGRMCSRAGGGRQGGVRVSRAGGPVGADGGG